MTINSEVTSLPPIQEKIDKLEASVNALLSLCERLSEENTMYKNNNDQLRVERSSLQTKNDTIRIQVEAMVERLKTKDKAS